MLLLACLIAPPLWWGGQWAIETFDLQFLAKYEFQKYFNRSILIAAVLLLVPAARYLQLTKWRQFGLQRNPHPWRDLGVGFALAFVLLIAMGLISYAMDWHRIQNEIRWDKFAKIPMTAGAVSILEEVLFRGVLLALVMRTAPKLVAVLFISALYSILHFLKPLNRQLDEITWLSGFEILPDSFHRFADPLLVMGGFFTLFAIGLVLAHTRLRTASLWMPIGLHAGWIAGNRVFSILFKQREVVYPWYGPSIEVGLAPLLTVILTGVIAAWYLRNRRIHSSL